MKPQSDDRLHKALRPESDFVWSQLTQSHYCKTCGQPAMVTDSVRECLGECAGEAADEVQDCAPEGHSYAVFASDQ